MSIVTPPGSDQGVCQKTVWPDSWHPQKCGRIAVDNGLCARHAAGERRSRQAREAQQRRENEAAERRLTNAYLLAADWLEGQDCDGSEDFGRGYMHAVRLLRGE